MQFAAGSHISSNATTAAWLLLLLVCCRIDARSAARSCLGLLSPPHWLLPVVSLIRHGWPPSLLVVYDEAWALVQQASALMADATGGNRVNMDILAWYVDPSRGDAGFSPHRDRQPDDTPATFRPDGSAMYATLWLPLTDASPENSCLYVIPRFADPGYFEGDADGDDAADPLTVALPTKTAYQHVRALPSPAGSACIFTHRTIHWGSQGRRGCPTPRISISWGCADDAYEPPYFGRHHLPCPPLALRLALAGAQMVVYHERFPAPPKQLALYYQAFTAQAAQFDAAYKAKVTAEFLDASKEATAAAAVPAAAGAVGAAAVKRGKKAAGKAAVAGLAAAAAAKGKGSNSKAKVSKAAPAENGSAADAVAEQGNRKRTKGSQQQGAAAEHEQPARQGSMLSKQQFKRQKQEQQQLKEQPLTKRKGRKASTEAAAAAAALQESSEEEDEGDGIDWAQVAAAAKATARKAKQPAAGRKTGKGSDSSSDQGPGFGAGDDDDDDEDNVMDLALDAVLDAQLAGQDFHDDFEDD
ncbi:hypothetical protein COO60DRAFT_1223221 [Scenedesmus sp. NREL 46B-D3]|nr:hypothetical protein COO60DRAFT_1223221 [Scenedesmus sp. NREL 46B-D3]